MRAWHSRVGRAREGVERVTGVGSRRRAATRLECPDHEHGSAGHEPRFDRLPTMAAGAESIDVRSSKLLPPFHS